MKNTVTIFLAIFFLFLSLGQLEKIQLFSSVSIYAHEIMMFIWLGFWSYKKPELLSQAKVGVLKQISIKNPVFLFILWISVGWLGALFTQHSLANTFLYSARLLFYIAFIFSLLFLEKKKVINAFHLKLGIFVSGCYLLYFGFLQYVFLPDTRFLQFLGWDDHYFRLISTILDPGFTGIILILTVFAFAQVLQLIKVKKMLIYAALFIFTVGIALTYSRATYLAYASGAGFAVIYYFMHKKKEVGIFFLSSLLLLAAFLPFLPRSGGEGVRLERTSTIISRTTSAQTDLDQIHGINWLTGQGLFTVSDHSLLSDSLSHSRVPDNWLVMLISGTGVVGTILFLLALAKFALKNWQKNPLFWFAFAAVLVHGIFNASLIYIFVLLWLGVLYVPLRNSEAKKLQTEMNR